MCRDDFARRDSRLCAAGCVVVDAPITHIDVGIGGIVEFDPFRTTRRGWHDFVDEQMQGEEQSEHGELLFGCFYEYR